MGNPPGKFNLEDKSLRCDLALVTEGGPENKPAWNLDHTVLLTCRLQCTGGEFIAPFDFQFFSDLFGHFAKPLFVQVGQDH